MGAFFCPLASEGVDFQQKLPILVCLFVFITKLYLLPRGRGQKHVNVSQCSKILCIWSSPQKASLETFLKLNELHKIFG